MFAYCNNNPTNGSDPCGKWTMGLSIGGNVTLFFGVSISIGIYWDDEGNVDWQWSYSVPSVDDTVTVGVCDFGVGVSFQYTEADTVYDLYGPTSYVGGSIGGGPYVGVDIISFEDVSDPKSDSDGFQITGGYGAGFDLHIMETNTKQVGNQSNLRETANSSGSHCSTIESLLSRAYATASIY